MDIPIRPGAAQLVLTASGWAFGIDPGLLLGSEQVQVRWFADTAVGLCNLAPQVFATIRLSAKVAPGTLTVRGSTGPGVVSAAEAVMPASLLPRPARPTANASRRRERVAAHLEAGEIGPAMAEVAETWLAGELEEGEFIAGLTIAFLAAHPLVRPDSTGALLATLCMRRHSR